MGKDIDPEELDEEEEKLNSDIEALSKDVNEANESFEAICKIMKDVDVTTTGIQQGLVA